MNSTVKPEELKVLLDTEKDMVLLDVRRLQDYEADPYMIPGAEWHNPEDFDDWCKAVVPNVQLFIEQSSHPSQAECDCRIS